MIPKFMIHPYTVTSKRDGDRHHISFRELVHLYGVNPAQCFRAGDKNLRGLKYKDFIHLCARFEGDYKEHLAELLQEPCT